VNGTDTSAGKESGNGVPGHGHVDGNGVALLDSHTLEDIGDAANFTEKLGVGDFAAVIWLVGLVDDCSLFGRKCWSAHNQISRWNGKECLEMVGRRRG